MGVGCCSTFYDLILKKKLLNEWKFENPLHGILISFSFLSNFTKLMVFNRKNNGLQCINGLKVIISFLIILGHRLLFVLGGPVINPSKTENVSLFFSLKPYVSSLSFHLFISFCLPCPSHGFLPFSLI